MVSKAAWGRGCVCVHIRVYKRTCLENSTKFSNIVLCCVKLNGLIRIFLQEIKLLTIAELYAYQEDSIFLLNNPTVEKNLLHFMNQILQ